MEDLLQCFQTRQVALDTSMLGAGKTYTSSYVASKLGLPVIVVCPASLTSKWEDMRDRSVNINKSISYTALAGKRVAGSRDRVLPHKLLVRRDYTDENDVARVDFRPSAWLMDRIGQGVLLVIDESQAVKNSSVQSLAVGAVLEKALLPDNPSRVLLMSGSPIDKAGQWVSYLRVLGVISSSLSLSDVRAGTVSTPGIEEYAQRAPLTFGIEAAHLAPPPDVLGVARKAECERWLYQNFVAEVLPRIGCAMTPSGLSSGRFVRDVFYDHAAEDRRKVRSALRALRKAEQELQERSSRGLGALTLAMQKLEMAKVNTFAREVLRIVAGEPRAHVVVGMNYIGSIEDTYAIIQEGLADGTAEVALVWGKTPLEKRAELTARFQDPEDPLRVLVCNTKVISTGIDLDDKRGDCPRTALISPTHHTVDMYQVTRRFFRTDSKSEPTVNVVFMSQDGSEENAAETHPERRVLDLMEGKGGVMKEVCRQQAEAGVLFPSDHSRVVCDVNGEIKEMAREPTVSGEKRGRGAEAEAEAEAKTEACSSNPAKRAACV